MAEEEIVQTESLELSPEESAAIVEGGEPEVVARELPSEGTEVDFSKYEGVSREDIIRQMEAKATPPTEEPPKEEVPPTEEPPKEETPPIDGITTEIFDDYASRYEANGGKLTEEDYAELAEKGITKEVADDRVNYEIYKNEQALKAGLAPYGSSDDIPDAIEWARANWTVEQREAFNKAVDSSEGAAQYAIVGGLLQQFVASQGKVEGKPIHGKGTPPPAKVSGYATKTEYMKDANTPAYDNDPSYRAQVEAKLAITDMDAWYKSVPRGV